MTTRPASNRSQSWFRRQRHPAPVALVAIVAVASCLHGASAPRVTPQQTMKLDNGSGPPRALLDQPFGVVFGTPQGPTNDDAELSLVFNRPMRALELGGQEVSAPVTITPAVAGAWRWIGTHALYFAPQGSLPKATEFLAVVPAGTRALDGSSLAQDYVLKFSTARPALVSTTPDEGTDHLRPDSHFMLRFNQPVANEEILRAVELSANSGIDRPVAFEVKRPDPQNLKLAELIPKATLPLNAALALTVRRSLRGTEGPLELGADVRRAYRTYGALAVEELVCSRDTPHGRCAARSSLSLRFTNAVKLSAFKTAVTVTPPLKIRWTDYGEEYDSRYQTIEASFVPGREYTVRVNGAVLDQHGQTLGKDATFKVAFDDLWPHAEIGMTGTYFEPSTVRDIPVASVNLGAMELATAALDDDGIAMFAWGGREPSYDAVAALRGASSSLLHPVSPTNGTAKHLVKPSAVLGGPTKRGSLAIALRYIARPETNEARAASSTRLVQLTDLGISAKVSRFGSLIWVARLSDGKPVADAEVRVRARNGAASNDFVAKTDGDGLATIDAAHLQPVANSENAPIIIVKSGDDTAWRSSSDLLYGWRYGISTNLQGELRPFGLVFTERGVYRPGDSVQIKGILRQQEPRGTSTPAGAPVTLKLSTPAGEAFLTRTLTLNEFGSFTIEAKIPGSAELGSYGIDVVTSASAHVYASFDVAEYRPSEFKVGVETDKRFYVRGDDARCVVHGDYLYGAPMAEAKVRTTILRGASWFIPPNTDGFETSNGAFAQDRGEMSLNGAQLHTGHTNLDKKGALSIGTTLTMPGQHSTEAITCEAEVMDLSRQTVASFSTALIHPAEFYLAIKAPSDFANAGEDIAPEFFAVDPLGQRQPGVNVDVELFRRTWVTAHEATGRGSMHAVSKPVDETASKCSGTTAATPASCTLRVPQAGYFIMRASAKDKRGNPIAASSYVYALGTGEIGWQQTDDDALELVPDKKSYEVGDTARVIVKSPFKDAEALVTVERSGVYTQRRMTLQGSMPTLTVPITEEMRPNGYLSVVMIRGRSKAPPAEWNAADVGAPAYRVGYANLRINPEARRLAVVLTPGKTDCRPGETTDVDIQVKDRAGRGTRAEVTLYAVDEGVLMLTGYKTPDPIPVFSEPRDLQVGYSESRTDLARLTLSPQRGSAGEDKGLEGGGGGTSVRQDFRQSAYFNPSIVTDTTGHARVSVKLPDNLTTYRFMAVVAATDDRFGFAESRVTTSRPLMARPAFPRILRAGDEVRAGVIVSSKTLPKSRVEVQVTAEGIVLLQAPSAFVELDRGESQEVTFGFRADHVGTAKLRFTVRAGGQSDAVEITKAVNAPLPLESVALYGSTRSVSGEKLGDLSAMRDDTGGLDVSVASTALVGMKGSVDQLLDYPYGCTEQLTSRLVPLIPLQELAKAYELALPKNGTSVINTTIAKIVRRQRSDGGFGMWDDSPSSNAWVSSYALWGLGMAKRYGHDVPKRTLDAATEYVRRYLAHCEADPYGLATAAFMVDVLAENGQPDAGFASRLFEQRDRLPLFGRAFLAHAIAVSKGDPKVLAELVRDLEGHVRVNGNDAVVAENSGNAYAVLMDSNVRTQALVLRTLVSAKPNHAMAAQLTRGLLSARRGGQWPTTQDSAYALLSLDEYRKAQEADEPNFVATAWLGDDRLFEQPVVGRSTQAFSLSVPAARLEARAGSSLAFQVGGDQKGTLYYEARLRYARKEIPSTALDRGFFLQKTMRVVTPEGLADALRTMPGAGTFAEPHGGDLVLVDLLVSSPRPQDFVVIDDPLPAGLEAIDSQLTTSAATLAIGGSEGDENEDETGDRDDTIARGGALLPSWYRREVRDDRVLHFVDHLAAGLYHYRYLARATTIGTFVLPPARVESMYQPEIFGRTAGASFRVVAQ